MAKPVRIRITNKAMADAISDDMWKDHRHFISALFEFNGWIVIKPNDLRYWYKKNFVIVEGVPNESIISK